MCFKLICSHGSQPGQNQLVLGPVHRLFEETQIFENQLLNRNISHESLNTGRERWLRGRAVVLQPEYWQFDPQSSPSECRSVHGQDAEPLIEQQSAANRCSV